MKMKIAGLEPGQIIRLSDGRECWLQECNPLQVVLQFADGQWVNGAKHGVTLQTEVEQICTGHKLADLYLNGLLGPPAPLLARITALEEALDDAISFIDCECDDEDRIARLRRVRSGARP